MTTLRSTKSNHRSLLRHALLLLSLTFGFAWLALAPAPKAFGVVPAPDGGYPNFTTAEGANALFSLTTGSANTAVGFFSLFSNATGSFNTAVGAGALDLNTADNNTAIGTAALLLNTTGDSNTATGVDALALNDTGIQNTANGAFALFNNMDGDFNTANGFSTLLDNTTGFKNTAIGSQALIRNTTGNLNTAIGAGTLSFNTTGNNNLALGNGSGDDITTVNGVICIGSSGANLANTCFIGQIRGKQTHNPDAIPVVIDSADQLGTVSSSRRFKKEIKPMNKASEAILGLNPVTFHYKNDETNTPCFGLIAEEVAQVNPDLVVRDDKGEIYTVRYDAVNAMLLNEFIKEHRKVDDLKKDFQATVAQLTARLEQQAAQIQKVSAQVEASKRAPQMVNNP